MERWCLKLVGILILLYGSHAHSAALYSKYLLEWENTETEIELKMNVGTLGYVGIGFSENETMANSDIIVAGIKNGIAYAWDCHTGENGELQVDEKQNVTIIGGVENDTHTIVTVTRSLFTDDESNDYQFNPGEVNVIWAFGQEDHALQLQISDFHAGSRGFQKLTLISDEDCTAPRSLMDTPPTTTSFIDGTTSLAHDHKMGKDSCDLPYQEFLDKDKKIDLKWDFEKEDIVLQLTAPTVGWMGIGFSAKVSMRGADLIMMGYRSDGFYAINCHAASNGIPTVDDKQDIEILSGYENGTHTSVRIKRKLKPCNKQDRNIDLSRTLRVLYAFAASDVIGDSPKNDNYHGMNRGGRSLILANPQKISKDKGIESKLTWEARVQYASIPAETTYYRCIMLELPTDETYYAIGYEPIMDDDNEMNLHHILVYDCSNSKSWIRNGYSAQCYAEMNPFDHKCYTVIAGWALGSTGVLYPKDTALALPRRMMLEIHYDNPSRREFVDNSGMRFHYTTEKPETAMAILLMEESISEIVVPPKSDNFLVAGYCQPECITEGLTRAGISEVTVYSSVLHSHTAGRSIRLRHFRDGKEMEPLSQDVNYDFDYQETRYLPPGTTIKIGDSFRLECVYETLDRDNVTTGGLPTSSEMCMAFLSYYPAIDLSSCFSAPKIFEDELVFRKFLSDLGLIVDNQELQTLMTKLHGKDTLLKMETLSPVLNRVNWTDEKKQTLRNFMENARRYPACIVNNKFSKYLGEFAPPKFKPYVGIDEDKCAEVGDAESEKDGKE